MEINAKDWYSKDYFTGRKSYTAHDGTTKLYTGPALKWEGFDLVADALSKILPKGTLLDIGCSAGDLAGRMMKRGYDAYGIDISEYAIENTVTEMKGRTKVADITTNPDLSPLPATYTNILATDLLEHLWWDDINPTLEWMYSKAERFLFFCVATCDSDKQQMVLKKGEPVPRHLEASAVAGHVSVVPWTSWYKRFKDLGWTVDINRAYGFQMVRETHADWLALRQWGLNTTFVISKT